MHKVYLPLFLLAFCFFGQVLHAQQGWKKDKVGDGIEIYTRAVPDTDFLEFKGVTVMDCNPETIFNLVRDFPHIKNWGYKIARAEVLEKVSAHEYFVYHEIDMPWPLDNRDMITHFRFTQNKRTGEARIIMQSIGDYIPLKDGIVRVTEAQGSYKLNPTKNAETEVIYQYYAEPEGLPAWIVNLFITDSPFVTLQNMREEIKKTKYAVQP